MITQLVCAHLPPTRERLAEFYTVMKNNVQNKFITKIYVFVEDARLEENTWPEAIGIRELWKNPKVEVIKTNKRHTYQELIDFANVAVKDLAMISNSDIYYDHTLELLKQVDFSKYAVCLSKIEITDKNGSIFKLTPCMCGIPRTLGFSSHRLIS